MAPRLLPACLRRTHTPASFLPRASSSSSSSSSSLLSVPPPRSFLPLSRARLLPSSHSSHRRFLSTISPIDHPSTLLQNPASPTSPSTPVLASTSTSTPPTPQPISVLPPSPSAIAQLKEDGMEIELVPEELAFIKVTDSAWKQLTKIGGREKDPGLRFRVAVESGGCHGYQYKMELTNDLELDDYTFSLPSSTPSSTSSDSPLPPTTPIIIDSASLGLLKGATIDFATELIGSSFRIAANPQAKGSGCGCGVSWEAI